MDVVRVRIPLATPYVFSRGTVAAFTNLLVRIHDEDGRVGLGECIVGSLLGSVDEAEGVLRGWSTVLVGREAADIESILRQLQDSDLKDLGPLASVDMALWDLAGKSIGRPVYDLLGGALTRRMPVDFSLGQATPSAMADQARQMSEHGFDGFSIKVGGSTDVALDVARVAAVREAVGRRVALRADANAGYSADQAIAFLRSAAPFDLEFLEQPVAIGDLDGLRRVASETDTPLAIDEGLRTMQEALALAESRAVGVFNIKVPKCGGISMSRRIAAVAESAGISCVCGGELTFEIARQASRHFTVATFLGRRSYHHEGPGPASQALLANVTKRVVGYEDVHHGRGAVIPDDRPGLGVDEDEEAVRRYALQG